MNPIALEVANWMYYIRWWTLQFEGIGNMLENRQERQTINALRETEVRDEVADGIRTNHWD